jgi:hypothetical protein
MAEIKVERHHRASDYHPAVWLWVPVAFVGILLVSLAPQKTPPPMPQIVAERPAGLIFAGHRYQPIGLSVTVPDQELLAIGHTQTGRAIFARRGLQAGGGGGGARFTKNSGTTYLKVALNTYQPLIKQD